MPNVLTIEQANKTDYPKIDPNWENGEFQHNYGDETPTKIHGWEWNCTFKCWSALVEFSDGWRGFTYPKGI